MVLLRYCHFDSGAPLPSAAVLSVTCSTPAAAVSTGVGGTAAASITVVSSLAAPSPLPFTARTLNV